MPSQGLPIRVCLLKFRTSSTVQFQYSDFQVISFLLMKMCWFSPQDLYFWHPFTLREDKGSSSNYIQPFAFLSCPETLSSTLRDKIHLIRFRHFQRGTLVGWNPAIFKQSICFLPLSLLFDYLHFLHFLLLQKHMFQLIVKSYTKNVDIMRFFAFLFKVF